ncbi:MFS transporter [Gilvimarinus agarilyticus]|uniref:MFS transporter n=1 Tax=Gilvimarinus sp. 2_MG-2023 TaxID=3062666 RepID=UPI001C093BA2|nr:MFS transporter [Gilvimarinus sp. 2_MG-2023]MBU2884595.1 MFS transporter [Gilvimarinus agarilyticus]MDO6569704.1 MFS transporter [Gilvimarinus sp. 2_MG-2023]
MPNSNTPATRLATRLGFLVAGFGIACWAPMVPFIKSDLGISEAILGVLLLCIGFGSLVAMVLTGIIATRIGSRSVILISGFALALILPLLPYAASIELLGVVLFAFGAAMGSLDVAINLHAIEVEQASDQPLMSGFHAMFSLGAFIGAGFITLLLSLQLNLLTACLAGTVIMIGTMAFSAPKLLHDRPPAGDTTLAMPRGKIWLIAALTAIAFLAEGGILDWSALLIVATEKVQASHGGLGYMLFAIAMVAGRLNGDRLATRFGDYRLLVSSGLLSVAGFVVLLAIDQTTVSLAGFTLIGLGLANIVPVLFRRAGKQKDMPPALAISAVTTAGYAGILIGPALIGFVAEWVGLTTSFWILAAMLLSVPLAAKSSSR